MVLLAERIKQECIHIIANPKGEYFKFAGALCSKFSEDLLRFNHAFFRREAVGQKNQISRAIWVHNRRRFQQCAVDIVLPTALRRSIPGKTHFFGNFTGWPETVGIGLYTRAERLQIKAVIRVQLLKDIAQCEPPASNFSPSILPERSGTSSTSLAIRSFVSPGFGANRSIKKPFGSVGSAGLR